MGVNSASESPAKMNATNDIARSTFRYSAPHATAAAVADTTKGTSLPSLSESLPAGIEAKVTTAQFAEVRNPICSADIPLEFSSGPTTVVTVEQPA